MEIQAVGIASISYDEESQKLINMRNQGRCWEIRLSGKDMSRAQWPGDGSGRFQCKRLDGRLYGHGCRDECRRRFHGAASAANMQQMQMNQGMNQAAPFQPGMGPAARNGTAVRYAVISCSAFRLESAASGTVNTGKFCSECGSPRPAAE